MAIRKLFLVVNLFNLCFCRKTVKKMAGGKLT